jgi:hypothetical protein
MASLFSWWRNTPNPTDIHEFFCDGTRERFGLSGDTVMCTVPAYVHSPGTMFAMDPAQTTDLFGGAESVYLVGVDIVAAYNATNVPISMTVHLDDEPMFPTTVFVPYVDETPTAVHATVIPGTTAYDTVLYTCKRAKLRDILTWGKMSLGELQSCFVQREDGTTVASASGPMPYLLCSRSHEIERMWDGLGAALAEMRQGRNAIIPKSIAKLVTSNVMANVIEQRRYVSDRSLRVTMTPQYRTEEGTKAAKGDGAPSAMEAGVTLRFTYIVAP